MSAYPETETETPPPARRFAGRSGSRRLLPGWILPGWSRLHRSLLNWPRFSRPLFNRPGFSRPLQRLEYLPLLILMAAAATLYINWSLRRFDQFLAGSYDLGIFDQIIRQYSLFKAPIVPIKGPDFNALGDHFHPLLVLIAPLYWIWPDPRMLGIAMALLIVASAPAIYLFARKRFSGLAALLATAAYLLWWPFQQLVIFDFHEVTLAIPLVAWLICCIDRGKTVWMLVLSGLLLLVREDMGLVIAVFGVILLIGKRYLLGLGYLLGGAVMLWLATSVLIPAFSTQSGYGYWHYVTIGSSAGAALLFLLGRPLDALAEFWNSPVKQGLWAALLLPFGWFGLASKYVLLLLPLLAGRFFSDRAQTWGVVYHYSSILAPIVVLAVLDTARKVHDRFAFGKRLAPAMVYAFSVPLLIASVSIPLLFPVSTGQPQNGIQVAAQTRALSYVPEGACVEADDVSVPHLVATNWVTMPGHAPGKATWLVLNLAYPDTGGGDDGHFPSRQVLAAALAEGWSVVFAEGDVRVLSNGQPSSPDCQAYLR